MCNIILLNGICCGHATNPNIPHVGWIIKQERLDSGGEQEWYISTN